MAFQATVDGQPVVWRDSKRYLWIIGAIVPLVPFAGYGLVLWTGWTVMWFFGVFFIFVFIPIIDILVGLDRENPPDAILDSLENDKYYRWVTYAFIPLQLLSFIWGAYLLGGGTMFGQAPLDWVAKIGLATGIGLVAGIGINTAHELGHKKVEYERWFARIVLAQTFYGHFFIEHNRGHHVRVATPEDPASSRLGENVWEFMPRTMSGSLKSAWGLEKKRFARLNKSHWTLKNDVLNAWAFSILLWGALMIAFGWQIFPYLVLQGLIGIWLLESVNYLEHYGMLRAKLPSGRFERVNPGHSWNSNNIGTNVLLYHLQRHSDHHANPTRRYQALRDFKESPVLPTGYAGMIVLSWVPAIWRRTMDPKVVAHYDGDVTLANLHPRNRDKWIKKYSVATQDKTAYQNEEVA